MKTTKIKLTGAGWLENGLELNLPKDRILEVTDLRLQGMNNKTDFYFGYNKYESLSGFIDDSYTRWAIEILEGPYKTESVTGVGDLDPPVSIEPGYLIMAKVQLISAKVNILKLKADGGGEMWSYVSPDVRYELEDMLEVINAELKAMEPKT